MWSGAAPLALTPGRSSEWRGAWRGEGDGSGARAASALLAVAVVVLPVAVGEEEEDTAGEKSRLESRSARGMARLRDVGRLTVGRGSTGSDEGRKRRGTGSDEERASGPKGM